MRHDDVAHADHLLVLTLLDLLEDDASSDLITAFERIRTNLVLRMQQTGALSIAVVSLDEGDGQIGRAHV